MANCARCKYFYYEIYNNRCINKCSLNVLKDCEFTWFNSCTWYSQLDNYERCHLIKFNHKMYDMKITYKITTWPSNDTYIGTFNNVFHEKFEFIENNGNVRYFGWDILLKIEIPLITEQCNGCRWLYYEFNNKKYINTHCKKGAKGICEFKKQRSTTPLYYNGNKFLIGDKLKIRTSSAIGYLIGTIDNFTFDYIQLKEGLCKWEVINSIERITDKLQ